MSNPYLTKPMAVVPVPDANSPVTFYYVRQSDGTVDAAVYDAKTQLPLWSQSFSSQPSAASATPAFNPFTVISQQMMQGADGSAAQAPAGMQVFKPFPMCPLAMGFWLPIPDASGNLQAGIAILNGWNNQVICYRKCVVDPTNHSFSIAQEIPVIGTCSITLQVLETNGQPSGFKGEFKITGGVFPVDVPVQIGSGA